MVAEEEVHCLQDHELRPEEQTDGGKDPSRPGPCPGPALVVAGEPALEGEGHHHAGRDHDGPEERDRERVDHDAAPVLDEEVEHGEVDEDGQHGAEESRLAFGWWSFRLEHGGVGSATSSPTWTLARHTVAVKLDAGPSGVDVGRSIDMPETTRLPRRSGSCGWIGPSVDTPFV